MLSGISVKPQYERHHADLFHSRDVATLKTLSGVMLGPGKNWKTNNRLPGKWSCQTWAGCYQSLRITRLGWHSNNLLETEQQKLHTWDQVQIGLEIRVGYMKMSLILSALLLPQLTSMISHYGGLPVTKRWRQKTWSLVHNDILGPTTLVWAENRLLHQYSAIQA